MRFKPEGFTLIEVMISLAITASLLVTILYTLNHHLGVADRHEILTTATLLAKMKLHEMERSPTPTKGYFDDPYSGYYYETAVRRSSMASMLEISVIVRSGKDSIRMAELISGNSEGVPKNR